jgi:hypothetical protein
MAITATIPAGGVDEEDTAYRIGLLRGVGHGLGVTTAPEPWPRGSVVFAIPEGQGKAFRAELALWRRMLAPW